MKFPVNSQPSTVNYHHRSHGKDPLLEITYYRHEALRATGDGKVQLALSWRLVIDAARNFFRQGQANYILSPQDPPFVHELACLMQATQEASYRLSSSTTSSAFFSSDWIFDTGELQEPAESYRYWIVYSQAKNSNHFQQEIKQASEAVVKYQLLAPEVAFFAQEAANYFKKTHELFGQVSLLELYRWKITAYAAAHVAMIYLHVEASLSRNNKILIHHSKEAARYGEHAFHFRIKAATATRDGNEFSAIHWSLAAAAANNVCDAHAKLLEVFPLGKEQLVAYWTEALHAAEEKMRAHEKAALDEKKISYWQQASFWREHHYDCCMKVIETYLPENSLANAAWEKAAQQAMQVASFWVKAAQKKERNQRSIASIYWKKKASRAEKRNEELLLKALRTEVFFCIPKQLLPDEMRPKIREEKERFFKIDDTIFRSWIYQTWKLLQEAGMNCKLSTYPVNHGINITLGACLPSSFGKKLPLPKNLFLVDVVADTAEHPAAHFYLLQNRVHAQHVPHSLFMPHWPQAGLIPRDPARETCFKNVFFLGEGQNLAPELRSKEWRQRLDQELGLHFESRGLDQWHDYHDVDCVIAIRDFSSELHLYKPATKLYNAWLAGVPFIGGRDSAYAADGHPGEDYLVATSLEEIFQHLKRLKEDLSFRSMLVKKGIQSSKAFTKEATLERWKKLIQETLPSLALQGQRK